MTIITHLSHPVNNVVEVLWMKTSFTCCVALTLFEVHLTVHYESWWKALWVAPHCHYGLGWVQFLSAVTRFLEKKTLQIPFCPLFKVMHVVEQCLDDEREEMLFRLFNEQMTSDSVVQYLRLLTSAHLQNHKDDFCNFVEAPNLQVYCHQVSNTVAAI